MEVEHSPLTEFIDRLEILCNRAFDIADEHRKNGRKDGLAFYYYGRLVSCFVGVKTLLFGLRKAASHKDFGTEYINDVLPAHFPVRNDKWGEQYIQETYMAIRFVLFQNFYSQTEFTYRIIQRDKYPDERTNPFKLIANKYEIMSPDFVEFVNSIRNTIHNNGYYFPIPSKPEFEYTFNNKLFVFVYGVKIDTVKMEDILQIIQYIMEENAKLFKLEELANINFD